MVCDLGNALSCRSFLLSEYRGVRDGGEEKPHGIGGARDAGGNERDNAEIHRGKICGKRGIVWRRNPWDFL